MNADAIRRDFQAIARLFGNSDVLDELNDLDDPMELEDTKPKKVVAKRKPVVSKVVKNEPTTKGDQKVTEVTKIDQKVTEVTKSPEDKKSDQKKVESLSKVALSCLSSALAYANAISDADELTEDLAEDELVRNDLGDLSSLLLGYIPYVGVITGGFTIGKHITTHAARRKASGSDEKADDLLPSAHPSSQEDFATSSPHTP